MSTTTKRHLTTMVLIACCALATLLASGCSERNAQEARAASNIWHAAEYLKRGGTEQAKALTAIQASAEAIAESNDHPIDPAGAELVLPQLRGK